MVGAAVVAVARCCEGGGLPCCGGRLPGVRRADTVTRVTILIVGGSGFLGSELVRQAKAAGHTTVATYATKPGNSIPDAWRRLDLRDAESLDSVVAAAQPRVVINASSGRADWAITAEGPVQLALVTAKRGTPLVHVSTDAVFSGAGTARYDESRLPDPVTPYGAAKAAAETGILAVHPKAVVARTSLIIGHGLSVHERLVHELATGTTDGALYTDDIRCPVGPGGRTAGARPRQCGRHPPRRRNRRPEPSPARRAHRRTRRTRRLSPSHGAACRQHHPGDPRHPSRQPGDPTASAHPTPRRPGVPEQRGRGPAQGVATDLCDAFRGRGAGVDERSGRLPGPSSPTPAPPPSRPRHRRSRRLQHHHPAHAPGRRCDAGPWLRSRRRAR